MYRTVQQRTDLCDLLSISQPNTDHRSTGGSTSNPLTQLPPLPAAVWTTRRKRSPADKKKEEDEERWAMVEPGERPRAASTKKDFLMGFTSASLPSLSARIFSWLLPLFPTENIQTRSSASGPRVGVWNWGAGAKGQLLEKGKKKRRKKNPT